jgi:hypothetical protein
MNEFGRRKEGVERRRLSDRENIERLRRSNQLAHLDQGLKANDLLLMMAMRENDGSESMLRTIERCNSAYFEKK